MRWLEWLKTRGDIDEGEPVALFRLADVGLRGPHNLANALAAAEEIDAEDERDNGDRDHARNSDDHSSFARSFSI